MVWLELESINAVWNTNTLILRETMKDDADTVTELRKALEDERGKSKLLEERIRNLEKNVHSASEERAALVAGLTTHIESLKLHADGCQQILLSSKKTNSLSNG